MYKGYVTDIEGIKVGHMQDTNALTGVTVVVPDEDAICGVDVRGGSPGSRETDLLKSENAIDRLTAIVLSGGSSFGLEASSGVMKYLEEQGRGFDVQVTKVPIVPQAVIFDLNIGNSKIRPTAQMGYDAVKNATHSENRQGNVGAGTGASVGKILGNNYAMKTGIGSATIEVGTLKVSAITALNAFGDIFDHETNKQIAGVYSPKENKFLNTLDILAEKTKNYNAFKGKNTTISVVVTNAILTKPMCNKVSSMAHNGFAMNIFPVHTMFDGDTIFTLANGQVEAELNLVGALASKVIARSIANAVYFSDSLGGLISYNNL